MNLRTIALSLGLGVASIAVHAAGAVTTWDGSGGDDWNATSWGTGSDPGAGERVIVVNNGNDGAATQTLWVPAGFSGPSHGALIVDGSADGSMQLVVSGVLSVTDASAGSFSYGSGPTIAGGTTVVGYTSSVGGSTGVLTLQDGGVLFTGTMIVGADVGSSGVVNVQAPSGGINVTANSTLIVGDAGTGVFNQSGGATNDVNLFVGNQATGNGTVNITGGVLSIAHNGDPGPTGVATVGHFGVGAVNQSNADGPSTVTIGVGAPQFDGNNPGNPYGGYLFIGKGDGGVGAYTITDTGNGQPVTLTVGRDIQIGGSNIGGFSCGSLQTCTGTFVQNGGIVSAAGVTIGIGSGTGSYTIDSGTLNAFLDIGNTSGGNTFTQNGGTVNAGGMFLSNGSSLFGNPSPNRYELNAGVLNTDSFALVGISGTAQFELVDGTHNVRFGSLVIGTGYDHTNYADATYRISGTGTVNAHKIEIAPIGIGLMIQDSGTVNATDVVIGGDGTFSGHGGTYRLNGGTMNVGFDAGDVTGGGGLIVGNSGQGTFLMNAGTLKIGDGDINLQQLGVGLGAGSVGLFEQSGGDVTVNGKVAIGRDAGSQGTYRLLTDTVNGSLPTLTVTGVTSIGFQGVGVFEQQTGTAHTITDGLFIGAFDGTYRQSGGTLRVGVDEFDNVIGQGTIVGTLGAGLFEQTGGTHTTSFLSVGDSSGSVGSYKLSGGGVLDVVGDTTIGNSGIGVFDNTGGTHTTNTLNLGNCGGCANAGGTFNSSGTYKLSGTGVLHVRESATVGIFGYGAVIQSGGSATIDQTLTIGLGPEQPPGVFNDPFREGVYKLSGGTLAVGGDVVLGAGNDFFAGEPGGKGTFEHSGAGSVTVTGSVILGQAASIGGGHGTYLLSGGTLSIGNDLIVGQGGTGTFTQTGGVVNVSTNAPGAFLTIAEAAGSTGSYSIGNGQLHVDGTILIGANGTGTMTVSAGAIVTTNYLDVGFFGTTGNGTLNVNGGAITVANNLVVGNPLGNVGTVNHSAGSIQVNDTFFGVGIDQGTYKMTGAGASLVVVNSVYVGNAGGTGLFEQSAGSVQIGGALVIGQTAGAVGTYTTSGGTTTVTGAVVLAANPGATGTLNVSGGALSAASITVNAGGTLNYSGGSLALGGGAGTLDNAAGGQVNFSGAGQRVLDARLQNSGAVTLSTNAQVNVLAQTGGTIALGGNTLSVAKDYTNANFGTGNAFNARAGVSGGGQIAGVNAAQTITGNVTAAGSNTFTLDLGSVRNGSSVTKAYQIANSGTGADIRGAVQTGAPGLGHVTDARLSGAGVTAGNFGPIAAGANGGNLSVTFNATSAGALSGQSVAVVSNFGNVATQTINLAGAAYNVAVGAATPTPVLLANQRVGGTLTQALTVANTAPGGAFSEALNAGFSGFTGNATHNGGVVANLAAGANNASAMSVGVNTSAAGLRSGSVTLAYQTDGTGPNGNSGLAAISAGSQTINVQGNVYNVAVGSATTTPVTFTNRHVGDTASQTLSVQNTAATGVFSEALNASFSGTSGAATHNGGSVANLVAGGTNASAMKVGIDTSTAGAKSGTVTIAYQSDGTGPNGNSGLAAISAGTQAISVSGDVYRLASANTLGAINFGVRHVGDVVSQTLTIQNTAIADGFSEKLNASFGSSSDVRITNNGGSVSLLAAGASNSTSMAVGLNTAAAGLVSGTITVHFASDGTGTSGLGTTGLASQNVGVSGDIQTVGSVFRLAQPSQHSPEPVNFGNVRVGASVGQALTISNLAPNDGFSEKLNASIGSPTGSATAVGSFNLLAAGATDGASLVVGLNTSSAGAKSGTATITLVSDGTGTSGLGQTALGTQTVNVSGNVYNMAAGSTTPAPVVLANQRVGGTLTQALTVANTAPSGAFSEALNASFSGAAGNATHNGGSVANLAAGASNASAMSVGVNTSSAGARSGSVTLAYQTDGTGPNGNSGLAAISAGTQTISVQGNVYNMAAGSASPTPVVLAAQRIGGSLTQTLSIANVAPSGVFSEALNASFSGATGNAVHNGGVVTNLAAGASNAAAMTVGVGTGTAGLRSGTVTIAYQTDGTGPNGNSGLAAIAAGSQTIDVSGKVYAPAVAQLNTTVVDFGVVRIGQVVADRNVTVTNGAAPTALNDTLAANIASGGSPFTASGSASALGAGQSNAPGTLKVGLNTSAAGVFSAGSAQVSFKSQNPDMADLDLGSQNVTLKATVNYFARPLFTLLSGFGLTGGGNSFTLDLGNLLAGSGLTHLQLGLTNGAQGGPQDGLLGSFTAASAGGFSLSGWNPLSSPIESGDTLAGLMVDFSALGLGTFTDTIVFHGLSVNASDPTGYALDDVTLVLRANVIDGTQTVPEPGVLALALAAALAALASARSRRRA
ncbi:MAG: choice-of-anchor D domain-containing protein [Burkholderiaceae bacterium]